MRIAIIYYSGAGHTRVLAEHVASGIRAEGVDELRLIDVEKMAAPDWAYLDQADAMVFGSPTYMGSAAAGFKTFMDVSSDVWDTLAWRDKIAAGFSVAAFPSGDKLSTLIQLSVFAAQHAMIWVGVDDVGAPVDMSKPGINRDGSSLGLMATSSRDKTLMIDQGDAETARLFGARIARVTRRWVAAQKT
ncbi:MAG: flavodoxin family protein [Paracoccaceae bacterium]